MSPREITGSGVSGKAGFYCSGDHGVNNANEYLFGDGKKATACSWAANRGKQAVNWPL
jgi:hypothetical protein